ncbi:MAG TPA: acylphosphatase [Patescibacteria group bacterium]|jgi:acylphosphatase|nr:acylphosphatase [Patescibacteria group bacterium]
MGVIERYKIIVTGKVQGVWFRDSARKMALQLGLTGFARNEPDGSVYIEAEGSSQALLLFLDWCRQGPREAKVSNIFHTAHEPAGHQNFEIM